VRGYSYHHIKTVRPSGETSYTMISKDGGGKLGKKQECDLKQEVN